MRLRTLLDALIQKTILGEADIAISDLVFDSRQAREGSLFVAIRGWEQDGHRHIPDALRRGSKAVVVEQPQSPVAGVTQVVVPDSRQALGLMAAAFFGFPGRSMQVVGVTGTDGKTTTTNLIGAMLAAAGWPAGLLSTIRAEYNGRVIDTGLHTTTPNPVDVQRYLREMLDGGVKHVVLETTSHALDQGRTVGCEYDLAVVTNVTPEHLDYHGTYGQYLSVKGRLFAALSDSHRKPGIAKVSVTNADDASYDFLKSFPADVHLSYSIEGSADIVARRVHVGNPTSFLVISRASSFQITTGLPGRYNVYNVLAAITAAIAMGLPEDAIIKGAAQVTGLAGRWEHVETDDNFQVVVDFAHTPNSLEQALSLARQQCKGRVIVVFGCAGLRDQSKRPLMGEIAGRLADIVVITSEDPRTEDVNEIIAQIARGCEQAGRKRDVTFFEIADRAEAIAFAVESAKAEDLVLLAGKGHEQSLCIDEVEYPWSEREAVAKALAKRRKSQLLRRQDS